MARPSPRPIEERHWPELYGRSLPPPDPAGEILAASASGAVKTASSGAAFALSARNLQHHLSA